MILKKGVNWKQLAAAALVMVGIFVALVPNIFGSSTSDSKGSQESGLARILWPVRRCLC